MLYQVQYKDTNGNIITIPLNAKKLGGKSLQQIIDEYINPKADDTDVVHKTGDTMTGQLVAQNNIAYTTAQMRNVILSTSEPTSSDGGNGDIWIVYAD